MTKKLNIAYVGFGKSTNRYHIPYVKERENIVIKRIVNRTLGKRPEQAELEANGFRSAVISAMNKCYEKSKFMSK